MPYPKYKAKEKLSEYNAFLETTGQEAMDAFQENTKLHHTLMKVSSRCKQAERKAALWKIAARLTEVGRIKASGMSAKVREWTDSGKNPQDIAQRVLGGYSHRDSTVDHTSSQVSVQGVDKESGYSPSLKSRRRNNEPMGIHEFIDTNVNV